MNYTYQKDVQDWLHFIRHQETVSCLELLPDGPLKILEIGGGDGYIASLLSKNGYVVISTDIAPRYPASCHVQKMSADHLEFSKHTFDVIFSSNVLEHIKELQPVFKELKRVAKDDALFVFILPTPAWRLMSSFWYIFRVLKIIFSKLFHYSLNWRHKAVSKDNSIHENQVKYKKASLYVKIKHIILHPHGEYPSFLHELYYFSPFRWKRLFIKSGFKIISHKRGPLFYSGEFVFKFKFISLRRFVARNIFSAGHIYIMRKNYG